mmetsp:Transcript_12863/g.17649  ORF Transcript_12863/g.17649 Transcript_12863/m.17649 type:complete len:129 (-) Transcript_12863:123-509(-)
MQSNNEHSHILKHHQKLMNPFNGLSNPFVDLNDEIEVDLVGECTCTKKGFYIEVKSSSAEIPSGRKQMERVLSIYKWSIRTIAEEYHQSYEFHLEGTVFIPKAAKRFNDNQDKSIYVEKDIFYKTVYI